MDGNVLGDPVLCRFRAAVADVYAGRLERVVRGDTLKPTRTARSFLKKNQKTFVNKIYFKLKLRFKVIKSFLLLFFKKEGILVLVFLCFA